MVVPHSSTAGGNSHFPPAYARPLPVYGPYLVQGLDPSPSLLFVRRSWPLRLVQWTSFAAQRAALGAPFLPLSVPHNSLKLKHDRDLDDYAGSLQ